MTGRHRQAVHPLGQGRHPDANRSVCAERFSRGDRRRISRGHRRPPAVRTRASLARPRLGAVVHAEPHSTAGPALGRDRRDAGPPAIHARPSPFPIDRSTARAGGLIGSGYELSLSYFDGFNHLPEISGRSACRPAIQLASIVCAASGWRGADAAVPFPWFTVKGEAASLKTTSTTADDVVLYVIQLERQSGELSLVGLGYAGEIVTTDGRHSPLRPIAASRALSGAGQLHDRHQSQRRARSRGAAERRGSLGEDRILAGERRPLARDAGGNGHRRARRRFFRTVPPQFPSSRDAKI